jgi:2-keto-3-deoxy-6-phosphogluconate aldolase
MRAQLIEALATEYGVSFATDENIKEQAIEEVEEKFGEDIPGDITETEMFNHARKEIIKSFSGENIGGLYLMESLHNIAIRVKNFLLSNELVEDVFSSDEELIDFVIDKIRSFAPKRN